MPLFAITFFDAAMLFAQHIIAFSPLLIAIYLLFRRFHAFMPTLTRHFTPSHYFIFIIFRFISLRYYACCCHACHAD